jgi:hypothetical protein
MSFARPHVFPEDISDMHDILISPASANTARRRARSAPPKGYLTHRARPRGRTHEPRNELPPPHRSSLLPLRRQPIPAEDAWERRRFGDQIMMPFAAVHESAAGPSVHLPQRSIIPALGAIAVTARQQCRIWRPPWDCACGRLCGRTRSRPGGDSASSISGAEDDPLPFDAAGRPCRASRPPAGLRPGA